MNDLTGNDILDVSKSLRNATIRCCASQIEVEVTLAFRTLPTALREALNEADKLLTRAREKIYACEAMWDEVRIERRMEDDNP